ncbi:DUF4105 domain-containing protein [Geobacter grbiciae]|nr:DUF4105 domain-containing protein [Geobacter grbiciae]
MIVTMPMLYCPFRKSYDAMGVHPLLIWLLVLIVNLAAFAGVCAGADDPYLAELLNRAAERQLHRERAWEVLLHYRPRGDERESLVDDPRFFLAPSGKTDPAAELSATLRSLFSPEASGDEHPRCRFPARVAWLAEELAIDAGHLPPMACPQLDEALAAVNPRSAVLVFPAAHPNGPASMFGHTLLRVGSTYRSDLLSYAVNYASHTTDTNGIVYAFKGIFGGYSGYYSILPYYEKVREYNDLEHRDVWEYPLTLAPDEVRRMVLHIWELRGIASDYYFFDENCSFNLLFLLEAARPELRLAEEFWDRSSFWVMPADTVAVIGRAGLIEKQTYRPAQATRILRRASLLSPDARHEALQTALSPQRAQAVAASSRPVEERRQILNLAAEYVQYRYSRKELEQPEFQRQFLEVLKVRSPLGPDESDAGEVPVPPAPETGHLPGRIGLGGGYRHDTPFVEASIRPAYHALMDADEGYSPHSQIIFAEAVGRYYPERHSIRLQRFSVVDIVSLALRDEFFKPISWKVNGGLFRRPFADGADRLFLRLNTGGGMAWPVPGNGVVYGMAELDLNLSDRLRDKAVLGAGVSAGVIVSPAGCWKVALSGSAFAYGLQYHEYYRLALEQNLALSRTLGLGLTTSWERSFDRNRAEAMLMVNRYF